MTDKKVTVREMIVLFAFYAILIAMLIFVGYHLETSAMRENAIIRHELDHKCNLCLQQFIPVDDSDETFSRVLYYDLATNCFTDPEIIIMKYRIVPGCAANCSSGIEQSGACYEP